MMAGVPCALFIIQLLAELNVSIRDVDVVLDAVEEVVAKKLGTSRFPMGNLFRTHLFISLLSTNTTNTLNSINSIHPSHPNNIASQPRPLI